MTTRLINGKSLQMQQLPKKPLSSTSLPLNESSSDISSKAVPFTPSGIQSSQTLITRTEIAPKTRIVVVRTSGAQSDNEETVERNDSEAAKSVELPPMFTNGRTSVYLIRRPIPPSDAQKQTKLFRSLDDFQQTSTTTTTTTDANNSQDIRTPTPTDEIATSPSQLHPSPTHPIDTHSENLDDLTVSPTQPGHSRRAGRHLRARSRRRSLVRSDSKTRSTSKNRARSARRKRRSPSPTQEEVKDTERKPNLLRSTQTQSTGIQVNLPPSETFENDHRRLHNSRPLFRRNTQRKKSATSRIKSAKSIVFVNPDDQTIAVVESTYMKGKTIKPVLQRPQSLKRNRFHQETDTESTEELIKTSRWHACLGCLSRHMCLIIIICLILILIGLAGVGASAYYLYTDGQTNVVPKAIGIAIGGVLAIAALIFLYCVLGCIGSRDGYFSYAGDGPYVGGRAFALIPPSHTNAHRYAPYDPMARSDNNKTPSLTSLSTITTVHQSQPIHRQKTVVSDTTVHQSQPIHRQRTVVSDTTVHQSQPIHRQKTVVNDTTGPTTAKNLTIEMPERLLTARKLSPKSHERQLNKVVNNIGHIVEDAKKRYNGDVPNKVIIKVDKNATPIA